MTKRTTMVCDGCDRETNEAEASNTWALDLTVRVGRGRRDNGPATSAFIVDVDTCDLCPACAGKVRVLANPRKWAREVAEPKLVEAGDASPATPQP